MRSRYKVKRLVGSGISVVAVGIDHYSSGRDPYLDGPVFLQRERPACTGQQLIPGLLADGLLAMPANLMDLGSGSSVSKKDAKLGFVVNYTNLLLIPGLL